MIDEYFNPEGIEKAEIAIFIPSCDEAEQIALPTQKAGLGLSKFYPDRQSVVVNCNHNFCSETKNAFLNTECPVPKIYASTPPGVKGKGANLANIFQIAANLAAKVVVILDANVLNVKSAWVKSLVEPILTGSAEFVAPLHLTHPNDAPISKTLVYPMMRSLFGRRVLQPISTDHAFSARLNETYRKQTWEHDNRGYRADLKMLALAIMAQAPIYQSFMAHPRTATLGRTDHSLAKSFSDVLAALFEIMEEKEDFWPQIKRSRPTAVFGATDSPLNAPTVVEIDSERIITEFFACLPEQLSSWNSIFSPELLAAPDLVAITNPKLRPQDITLTAETWRRVIFQTSWAFRQAKPENRLDLTSSLAPLFLARRLSHLQETEHFTEQQHAALLEQEAQGFENSKGELLALWQK